MGIFGGLGTDPNSMIPMALLAAGGYLAVTPVPAAAAATAEPVAAVPEASSAGPGVAGVTGCGRPRCGSRRPRQASGP